MDNFPTNTDPDSPTSNAITSPTNRSRARRCDRVLGGYDEAGSTSDNLIDLLADAMHWCVANGVDFHISLAMACRHYLNERNDER